MKYFLIFLLIISFGCKSENENSKNYLEVVYHTPGALYPMRLGCGFPRNIDSLSERYKYIRIEDKISVDKFIRIYNQYKIDTTNFGADVRIHILVHQNLKVDTLCLGEHFGVVKNGQSMEDSKELLKFLKKRINFEKY